MTNESGEAGSKLGKIDWGTDFGAAEYEELSRMYDGLGGPEVLRRFRFIPFMYDLRPDALKRYRLFINTVTGGVGLKDPLPNPPYVSLVMTYFYLTLPYAQGIIAEIECAKKFGATKKQVADILACGWIHAGPYGMNTIAEVAQDYMARWDPADGAPGIAWPAGWRVEPEAFVCGVDFSRGGEENMISADDLAKLERWHREWEGTVPAYVSFFGKHYPLALRAFRARYENAMTGDLPLQFIALCRILLAATWMRPEAMERALHFAERAKVSKDHVVEIIALSQLYRGDTGIDPAIQAASAFFDR